jgi:hypothetical protein
MSTYNKVIFRKYFIGQPATVMKFLMQHKKVFICQNLVRNKIHGDRSTLISAEQLTSELTKCLL